MSKLWKVVTTIPVRTTSLLETKGAPVLALSWVLLNLALGWLGVATAHPNIGALTAGALDGAIFSAIVLVRASARLEAGMTGLLSGFGLDSITNGGRMVAKFVHGVHELLETIINVSTDNLPPGHHQDLELMIMRAIWMAIVVMLLSLFVKWGQTAEASLGEHKPNMVTVPVPAEVARGQAA